MQQLNVIEYQYTKVCLVVGPALKKMQMTDHKRDNNSKELEMCVIANYNDYCFVDLGKEKFLA